MQQQVEQRESTRAMRISVKLQNAGIAFCKVHDESHKHAGHGDFSAESHLLLELAKDDFPAMQLLQVHRQINGLLQDEFLDGLHALSIRLIDSSTDRS